MISCGRCAQRWVGKSMGLKAAVSEELFIGPISCRFDILGVQPDGVSHMGSCDYTVFRGDSLVVVRVSSVISLNGVRLSESRELRMSAADFDPVSFSAFLSGPSGRTSVRADYRFPSHLGHLRPLTIDPSRVISLKIAHMPELQQGHRPRRRLIMEKRPHLIDGLSLPELLRSMAAEGRLSESRVVFDPVSGLYLDCDISRLPGSGSAGRIGYRVRSLNRKLGISLDEELLFDGSPPFVLLKHSKPSQIMEISEWSA